MDLKDTVVEYYRRVDAGDLEWVLELFADDSAYTRAEAHYGSKAEIADFYRGDRKITGVHTVREIFCDDGAVICNGVFDGHGADGSEKHVGFADFWVFDDNGRVTTRRTYLAVGSAVVRD